MGDDSIISPKTLFHMLNAFVSPGDGKFVTLRTDALDAEWHVPELWLQLFSSLLFFFKWMAPIPKKGSHSIFYGVQWAPVKWAYQNCSFSKFYNLKTDFMCLHFLKVTCLSSCPGTTSKIWLFEEKTSACVLTWVTLDSSRVYC